MDSASLDDQAIDHGLENLIYVDESRKGTHDKPLPGP